MAAKRMIEEPGGFNLRADASKGRFAGQDQSRVMSLGTCTNVNIEDVEARPEWKK